ncbi:hypothetical protein NL676_033861 [Syzygium grande]|nr:hypothetical protein NL676_033861 [Syzygium grande]
MADCRIQADLDPVRRLGSCALAVSSLLFFLSTYLNDHPPLCSFCPRDLSAPFLWNPNWIPDLEPWPWMAPDMEAAAMDGQGKRRGGSARLDLDAARTTLLVATSEGGSLRMGSRIAGSLYLDNLHSCTNLGPLYSFEKLLEKWKIVLFDKSSTNTCLSRVPQGLRSAPPDSPAPPPALIFFNT